MLFQLHPENRSGWDLSGGMDLDAAVLVQHDLPTGIAAAGGLDVTLVELADEDRNAPAEFHFLGTGRPSMSPRLDSESVAWCRQVGADRGACCSFVL
ncbi:MAG TPA: hypothetical protein VGL06_00240 [Pseudonocardiaceae bacterium]